MCILPSSTSSCVYVLVEVFFYYYYCTIIIHCSMTTIHTYYVRHRFIRVCTRCVWNNARGTAACLKAWIRAGKHFTLRAYSNDDDWGTRPLTIKLPARHATPAARQRYVATILVCAGGELPYSIMYEKILTWPPPVQKVGLKCRYRYPLFFPEVSSK